MDGRAMDVISEVGEFLLDEFLKEGLLKDFPILGTVIKTLQLGNDVSNHLLARKLQAFLRKINDHYVKAIDDAIMDKEKLAELGCELIFIIDTHFKTYIYLLYIAPFMTWVFEFTSHFQF